MLNFEQIPNEYKNIWEKWAIAKAEFNFLDEERKTVLARCSSKYEGSEATKERLGRQDEEYTKHRKAIKQAEIERLTYETYLRALDMRFDWHRAQNANRRTEMKLI